MASVDIDVRQIAHLARLALEPGEADRLATELKSILSYVEKLNECDVTQVEAMAHPVPLVNVTRPDEVRPSLPQADALRNSPAQVNGLFQVPKIVE